MHILFEGLDLAGKSTVCRRFAEKAGPSWSIRNNRISEENPIYETANALRKRKVCSDEAVGYLYYAVLLADIGLFKRPDGNVIQDSTIILRSLAFHSANGNTALAGLFEGLLPRHPGFDAAFICSASREVRLRRLSIRRKENLSPEDFLIRDNPDLFFAMEKTVIRYAEKYFKAEVIDTSELEDGKSSDSLLSSLMTKLGI